jgi:hypothetical protein
MNLWHLEGALPIGASNVEAASGDGLGLPVSGNKTHRMAGFCEHPTEIAANRTSSHHRNTHVYGLI